MAKNMAQIDYTPATQPQGLHVHIPSGSSASGYNNAADYPAPVRKIGSVMVNVSGVRLSNPA